MKGASRKKADETRESRETCELCVPYPESGGAGQRCGSCVEGGDLIGKIAWNIVRRAVDEAEPGQRVTFMLAGLTVQALEGIARAAPTSIDDRSTLLRLNPRISPQLRVDKGFLSSESAVHWRHSAEADVIVFAPPDEQRQEIGAGLGPIDRIGEREIIREIDAWVEILEESGEAAKYLSSALEGLRRAETCIDLRMWVDFVMALSAQRFAGTVDTRVGRAAPALRIPLEGIAKLPAFKQGGNPKAQARHFEAAFRSAQFDVGCYATLMTPKQERVEIAELREALDNLSEDEKQEFAEAVAATRDLLDDEATIKPGKGWQPSQSRFCANVPWARFGSTLFEGGQRRTKETLGERTLEYILGNFEDDVTEADRGLLNSMKNAPPREPLEDEIEFFDRWRERLSHPNASGIFKGWQKRLFSKEIVGNDLLETIAEGFEALVIAGAEVLPEMERPRVLVRATRHNKADFWKELDLEVQRLFRFELNCLRAHFGEFVTWDLEAAFKHDSEGAKHTNDARQVALEIYLVEESAMSDLGGSKPPPRNAPRVKAIWQPGVRPKDEPVGLGLVDDVRDLSKAAEKAESLFRRAFLSARSAGADANAAPTTLKNRKSFSDVIDGQDGRSFDLGSRAREDLLAEIRETLDELERDGVATAEVEEARTAVSEFESRYRTAIRELAKAIRRTGAETEKEPEAEFAFLGEAIDEQARAFGAMCRACRLPASAGALGSKIRALVAAVGVIESEGTEDLALLAAWHPLRLAERRAKIRAVAKFVALVLDSKSAQRADQAVAFEELRVARSRWVYPEVVVVGGRTMISVEDVAGHSLMVPANDVSRNQEALESSAKRVAEQSIRGVDEYLYVRPHEATNLSVAILECESETLPLELAREMAERLRKQPDLRCKLVLSNESQTRLRGIFKDQNVRFGAQNVGAPSRGILSPLQVVVRPGGDGDKSGNWAPDVDVVILHDAVSRHARPSWGTERGEASTLDEEFGTASTRLPRRRLRERDATGVDLIVSRPPRPVAEYHDLLYELAKDAFIPSGARGTLVRQIHLEEQQVKKLVGRAHNLGAWVITCDKVASPSLLKECEARIISDVSLPGSEERVIISARDPDPKLERNIQRDLVSCCGFDEGRTKECSGAVMRDVLLISGQKVLAAARRSNASKEMIGLAVMRAQMAAILKENVDAEPVWISLDDYRSWFATGSGKVADAVAVAVFSGPEGYCVYIQVGEAKFVERSSETSVLKDARTQVRDTLDRLKGIFVDNDDPISRTAWCARLGELLVNREGVAELMPSPEKGKEFLDALCTGDVHFRLGGEAVVCLHDDHESEARREQDVEHAYLRHHVLASPDICKTLRCMVDKELPGIEGMPVAEWYSDESCGEPRRDQRKLVSVGASEGKAGKALSERDAAEDGEPTRVTGEPARNVSETDSAKALPKASEIASSSDAEPEVAGDARAVPVGEATVPHGNSEGRSKPRFIPAPVFDVLREMASAEEGTGTDAESLAWAEPMATELQKAFSHFEMEANFAEPKIRMTPNGALVSFRGNHTLTVAKIEKRREELLTTYGIEVADVRPGRGTISVFVKREDRATVPLASTWLGAEWPDRDPGCFTSFIVGAREDDDRLLYLNLGEPFAGYEFHGPHTLIAGETGSGKGILTQSLLLQLVAFNDPREAELVLVDPKKGVDFGWLDGVPHMKGPIVTETEDALRSFAELVGKMEERYDRFRQAGVANIAEFNAQASEEERISRIFLVHDELGSWMAQERDYQKVVLSAVSNLGMKARAAGIHLILVTQRADADAVPSRLRSNMGNQLCLKVRDADGSRMVLGVKGAERLLGKGHLACVLGNQPPPPGQDFFVVQVPFAQSGDILRLAESAKSHWSSQRV